jgi:hypothetical protein
MLKQLNDYIKAITYLACILECAWQLTACSPHSPSDGLTHSHQAREQVYLYSMMRDKNL